MSALPPKADIGRRELNVRFVPKADIANLAGPRELIVQPESIDYGNASRSQWNVLAQIRRTQMQTNTFSASSLPSSGYKNDQRAHATSRRRRQK
jgi:hypothetical protein